MGRRARYRADAKDWHAGVLQRNGPYPIRECLMTFYNGPAKIGKAVCMPGDISWAPPAVSCSSRHILWRSWSTALKNHMPRIYLVVSGVIGIWCNGYLI